MNTPISQSEARRLAAKFCGATVWTNPPMAQAQAKPRTNSARDKHTKTTRERVLSALRAIPGGSTRAIASRAGLHETTARDHLADLHQRGNVTKRNVLVGRYKHAEARWRIKDANDKAEEIYPD